MTLKELGFDHEEDSPDLSAEEAADAEMTESETEFVRVTAAFVRNKGPSTSTFALRRLAGALYARVTVGTSTRLFRLPWLQKEPTHEQR